jgi:hypothetical protein
MPKPWPGKGRVGRASPRAAAKNGRIFAKIRPKNHQCKMDKIMNLEYIPAVLLDLSDGVAD